MSKTNVPVGVSSVAGYSVTIGTFAAAVVAYLNGDHSQNTIVVLALGAFSAVSFAITQVGRYAQAHAQAKKPAPLPIPESQVEVPVAPVRPARKPAKPKSTS